MARSSIHISLWVVAALLCGLRGSYSATPNWSAPAATNSGVTQPMPTRRPSGLPVGKTPAQTTPKPATGPMVAADSKRGGNAAALFKLLRQPDNVTATINGHTISAGALRSKLRVATAKVGKQVRGAAVRKIEPVRSATELARQNELLLLAIKKPPDAQTLREMKLAASLPPDAPASGPYKVQAVANGDGVASTKPCPERGPGIVESKGSALTPGAMVAFRGSCLGANSGEVRMYGEFPGGVVKLQVDLWTDDSFAATVPADLSGVLDQTASVQVSRTDGSVSNARRLPFTARRGSMRLPVNLISIVSCAQSTTDCSGSGVVHFATRSDDENDGDLDGSDTWRIGVGNGWVLQSLDFDSTLGAMTASGFEKGEPGSATVNVAWDAAIAGSMDADNSAFADIFRPFLIENKIYWYEAAYSPVVSAVGPVGVSPDPSVKPPYAGKHGTPGLHGTATVQNAELGKAAKPTGTDRVPDWNTPAAGSTGGGSSVSGTTFHPKQLPGSWTTPQPGAPVESPLGGKK